jgi:hypothetical protein
MSSTAQQVRDLIREDEETAALWSQRAVKSGNVE